MPEAIERLRGQGYGEDVSAVAGGRLRCGGCGAVVPAADVAVVETVRFEGESDPADEVILLALNSPCGHRGLYDTPYGPAASPADVEALQALTYRQPGPL
jgi:hypothetical protein